MILGKWRRNRANEPEEVSHYPLDQTIETWISQVGAVTLKSARDHLVLVFVINIETEDIPGESVVHSVEASVARIHVAFDQVREDAQALGSVNVDLLTILVVHEAEINGVHDAHLQSLDILFTIDL